MTNFELARRYFVYSFDTNSTITPTNGTKGIKVKCLGGVSTKWENYMHASIKRVYKEYHRQHFSIMASNIIDILKEPIWLQIRSSSTLFKSQKWLEGNQPSSLAYNFPNTSN